MKWNIYLALITWRRIQEDSHAYKLQYLTNLIVTVLKYSTLCRTDW